MDDSEAEGPRQQGEIGIKALTEESFGGEEGGPLHGTAFSNRRKAGGPRHIGECFRWADRAGRWSEASEGRLPQDHPLRRRGQSEAYPAPTASRPRDSQEGSALPPRPFKRQGHHPAASFIAGAPGHLTATTGWEGSKGGRPCPALDICPALVYLTL